MAEAVVTAEQAEIAALKAELRGARYDTRRAEEAFEEADAERRTLKETLGQLWKEHQSTCHAAVLKLHQNGVNCDPAGQMLEAHDAMIGVTKALS